MHTSLDGKNLLSDHGQHLQINTVELIKTGPGSTGCQTLNKNINFIVCLCLLSFLDIIKCIITTRHGSFCVVRLFFFVVVVVIILIFFQLDPLSSSGVHCPKSVGLDFNKDMTSRAFNRYMTLLSLSNMRVSYTVGKLLKTQLLNGSLSVW